MEAKKLENIILDLNVEFRKRAIYRIRGLTKYQVAQLIEKPPYLISLAINKILNKKFNDYVNDYRIEEATSYLKEKSFEKYTIDGIAKKVGFSSSSSFYEAFKKRNNCTPLEFHKSDD